MVTLVKIISIAGVLLVLICSSLSIACESGIWADKCTYKTGSDVLLSYETPDITNGSHLIKVFKGDAEVKSSGDLGKANSGSFTWHGVTAEGSYTAKLFANGSETPYGTCTFSVKDDDIAPTTTYSFSKSKKADGSYDTGVKLSFSATDNAGGTGVSCIYYWFSDGNHKTYCTPLEFNQPGTYTITFKAADNAGNLETVDGNYRTLTFTVTSPATAPAAETTATPTATPTACPTDEPKACPTEKPTAEPLTINKTAYDVSNPMEGTEALFTADAEKPTAESNSGTGTAVAVGAVVGIAVAAGAVLLIFRRL